MAEGTRNRRRVRIATMWIATAMLVAAYVALPSGDDATNTDAAAPPPDAAGEPHKLEILQVTPAETPPGTAVIVGYHGADDDGIALRVFAGKTELEVLARRPGSLVARLPADIGFGRAKLRVADGDRRSKPYDLRIKAQNWRKPFRGLVGGLALLALGIGVLARGVREAVGVGSARRLALLARNTPAALGFGTAIGSVVQSTTAAAGVLAGLVTSNLLAVTPAAVAFLGAQLGAATAPLLITGFLDPREGLLAIAFGLHVLRPAFEPFVADNTLIPFIAHLRADSIGGMITCALLGAALVAAFQGPAPVVVLVLSLAQTTGHLDLRTALAILSGSALGAAIGALLTTPAGARSRRLVQLHLLLGVAGTTLALATVRVWSTLADRLVAGSPHEVEWGKRVLLPNMGKHLGIAFALSQIAIAIVLAPCIPALARALARLFPETAPAAMREVGDRTRFVRDRLARAARVQRGALGSLLALALRGVRVSGRVAEHALADARATLEEALQVIAASAERTTLARGAYASLQLERSLESLLRQAEMLTDRRVAAAAAADALPPLPSRDEEVIVRMHGLLSQGLDALLASLDGRAAIDVEEARAREIEMNAQEARGRQALLVADHRGADTLARELGVLELVDAFESAGNQVYRAAEAFADDGELAQAQHGA